MSKKQKEPEVIPNKNKEISCLKYNSHKCKPTKQKLEQENKVLEKKLNGRLS